MMFKILNKKETTKVSIISIITFYTNYVLIFIGAG